MLDYLLLFVILFCITQFPFAVADFVYFSSNEQHICGDPLFRRKVFGLKLCPACKEGRGFEIHTANR